MKPTKFKQLILILLFMTVLNFKSLAQFDVSISNSLTPSCSWSLDFYTSGGVFLASYNATGLYTCTGLTGVPGVIYLRGTGCTTYTWSGGTWTGPFTFSCTPPTFCTPAAGSFSISTGTGCSGVDVYTFSF
jgi:hypothetical protein